MTDSFRATLEKLCGAQGWQLEGDSIEVSLDGRQQTLSVRPFDFEGQPLARLHTVVGDARRMDAMRLTQGLRITFKLPHGALALDGDKLVVVDTVSQNDSPDAIAAVVRYLVETGDHFERTMFGSDEF